MSLKAIIEDRFLPAAEKAAGVAGVPVIFDVAQIMQTLYGYLPARVPGFPAVPSNANTFNVPVATAQKRTTLKGSPIYGSKDMIGREVFCPITIQAGGVDYEFPFVVAGLKTKKLLVETPMIERSGSVIEEIGIDAWRISVKGFLIDPLNQFPDDQLDQLNQMFLNREPVRIKSALTDIFLEKNDRVVISTLDIPEKAKVIGVRDFSFELIQDGIFDLTSIE